MRKALNIISGNKSKTWLVCLVLILITFCVYFQVSNHPFCNFDDDFYVGGNRHVTGGITGSNIIWAFTSFHAGNWHPLTWLSLMLDGQFYCGNPHGYHVTNLIIHILTSLLLLFLLFRTTGSLWKSAFTSALFALHPLHVESVAWVTERKDVLSALFYILTLLFYTEYIKLKKPAVYFLAIICFFLGLMAKSMLVTLPIIMIFIDFWPLDRCQVEESGLRNIKNLVLSLIKEKLPFFFLSLFVGIMTIYAQNKGGATRAFTLFPLEKRIDNALISYVKYIGNTIWPHDLAIFYPYPSSIPLWQTISSLLILVVVSFTTIRARRRHPYLLVGWFWFLITLIPVIGLFQVGDQAMADRYSYLPIIGLFIMAAWGVSDLTRNLPHRQGILFFLGGTVIVLSAVLTWEQLGYWKDDITLYQHTAEITSGNYVIHFNLGLAFARNGNIDDAIKEYEKAIKIEPRYFLPYSNLGVCLAQKGNLDAAIKVFEDGTRVDPDDMKIRNNLNVAISLKRSQSDENNY
jgi:protein O-mannosyl-transferase